MILDESTGKKEFIRITDQQFAQKYKMIEGIGKGAFGQVHKARSKHNSYVAIKKFNPEATSRFYMIIREISNLKKMDHANVLKLYDCYIVNSNRYYMVTEYCPGGCLTDFVTKLTTNRDKMAICFQIAEGLAHAHRLGIVHRDLKPENIFIGQNNIAKIGDFGCSTKIDDNGLLTSRVGSPAYMDDRVDKKENYDNTADIYSLGMVYLSIFLGKGIYDNCANMVELDRRKIQINGDYNNKIEAYIEGLPLVMKEIVKNCLNPDFAARYSAEKIATSIGEELQKQIGSSRNLMMSTEDESQDSFSMQASSFACSLIGMNRQFQYRHSCLEARERLLRVLIKAKQELQKVRSIEKLKYVEPDAKAQFTFVILLFYQYWLQQMQLFINGEYSELAAKYKHIDPKSIDEEVLGLATRHIRGEQEKIQGAMTGCAKKIQTTLHLMSEKSYLPEHFKYFVNTVSQKQKINFNKTSYKALLGSISTFFTRRIMKQYEFNRGEDKPDPTLQVVKTICDSFS